jgi:hypothetical protein
MERYFGLALVMTAAIALAAALSMSGCGGDSDDDDSSDDDTGGNPNYDAEDFDGAVSSCVAYFMQCGYTESQAEANCAYLDDYKDIWSDCISEALDNQFECYSSIECNDEQGIFDCLDAFNSAAEQCLS